MAEVSIVIPTYNEAENVESLIEKLEALEGEFQIIFVDDNSPDGTAEIVEEIGQRWGNIKVHRRRGKLGIGSAILEGMERSLSFSDCHYVVTMDADLSHDPQDIPRLLSAAEGGSAGLIQGSRYMRGGGIIGWNFRRKLQSRVANLICRMLFGLPHEVTTYFRVYTRKSAQIVVREIYTDKYEFAVLSALAVKDHGLKIKEVPVIFVNRTQGKSKLKTSDVFIWLAVIFRIFLSRQLHMGGLRRFLNFCLVGALGVVVNVGLLWLLTEFLGIFYILSAAVSIETSILFNFALNDLWTFRDRRQLGSNTLARVMKYNLTCAVGVGINLGILALLSEAFGIYYIISNLIGIAGATLWNFTISTLWAWRAKSPSEPSLEV
jgi:dolichol-phosphate mannosyltransferase